MDKRVDRIDILFLIFIISIGVIGWAVIEGLISLVKWLGMTFLA